VAPLCFFDTSSSLLNTPVLSLEDKSCNTPQVLPGGPLGAAKAPIPAAVTPASTTSFNYTAVGPSAAMPPPQMTAKIPISVSIPRTVVTQEPTVIAPQPTVGSAASSLYDDSSCGYESQMKHKKKHKRAANRRSAQLSRKRKKMAIEDLKEENDDLRRKEQILKSIPDLIVVFDSSGRLWFVSESVERFLSFSAPELEGTSFWDRLCEDSVRLLKAAFMDALAARQSDSDSAPLGSGVWELRLVDKDGEPKFVTLNGVVHFAGERPECVCSIRPRDDPQDLVSPQKQLKETAVFTDDSKLPSDSASANSLVKVKPQQSVVSHGSSSVGMMKPRIKNIFVRKRGEAVRISDSGNSSEETEGGSSDEMAEVVA
jgi:PAS domain S-box-containing protein